MAPQRIENSRFATLKRAVAAPALAALLTLAGCEVPPSEIPTAQDVRGLRPSGRVTLNETFVSGTGIGGGTLSFKGRAYPFTLAGELIGLGAVAHLEASGEVYGLRDIFQFPGAYVQGTGALAVSATNAGEIWLANNHGVIMRLNAYQAGLTLSTGRYQIFIQLAK